MLWLDAEVGQPPGASLAFWEVVFEAGFEGVLEAGLVASGGLAGVSHGTAGTVAVFERFDLAAEGDLPVVGISHALF